jgi:hypothetical protein
MSIDPKNIKISKNGLFLNYKPPVFDAKLQCQAVPLSLLALGLTFVLIGVARLFLFRI